MDFKKFLLLDLDGTIWHDSSNNTAKRNQERKILLTTVLGIHETDADRAISYLQEVINRYQRHFNIPSPLEQLKIIFEFLGVPEHEMITLTDSWFEILLEYPPDIDFSFISTVEKLKSDKNLTIAGYTSIPTEHIKYIKHFLSIQGFLYLFDEIYMGNEMKFIPPSPLALSHIPPPGIFEHKLIISSRETTLKSALLAGYNKTFIWGGDVNTIFTPITNYSEIILKVTQI